MSGKKIKIKLLGTFEILIDGKDVLDHIKQSKKTRDFLIYLLLRKDKAVSHSELLEKLWLEDENVNPETALRTLLYRYRKLLSENNILELKDSIITNQGTYQWNPELDCEIDVYEFENLCKEANDPLLLNQERIQIYMKAMDLYSGDLIPSDGRSWIVPRSIFYHDLFLKNILNLIDLLKQEGMQQEIIRVCQSGLEIDLFDDSLHLELIQALMESGKNQAALSLYQATSDMFYKQLGVAPSDKIRSLYKRILRMGQDMEVDIQKIQQSINEEDASEGAFICEYQIFKDIYNLQSRLLERTDGTIFIALLTLNSINNEIFEPKVLDALMKQLSKIAQKSLRRGDTIARYSSMQYVIMLPTVTYETGKMVIERIKRAFYKDNKFPAILTYKLRPLERKKVSILRD